MLRVWDWETERILRFSFCGCNQQIAAKKRRHFMHDFAVAATFVAMVLSPIVPTLFYREVEEAR
jgi:hypothetical protein